MASSEKLQYDDLPDAVLLERFVAERDEAAFAAMVRRHHGLVFGVCRRRLRCRQDAEDAFQATFLVLAEKGHRIRRKGSLASWLYGVAYRVALRLSRERAAGAILPLEEPVMVHDDPLQILAERHEQLVTDEELTALPERLRAPLVLRYLAGKSNEEVAGQLGISVAAVESRLKRARQKLRRTLTQRGIALSTTLVSLGAAHTAGVRAAEPLIAETVALCLSGSSAIAAGSGSVGASTASQTAVKLATKEVYAMTTLKLSHVAAFAVAVVCTASLGFGLRQALSQSPGGHRQPGLRLAAAGADDAGSQRETDPFAVADTDDPFAEPEDGDPFGDAGNGRNPASSGGTPNSTSQRSNLATSGRATMSAFDMKALSEGQMKIRSSLENPATVDFFDMPLNEAMDEIARRKDILIEFNRRALEDQGVDTATSITASYHGISLRAALRLILEQFDLTYVVEDEYLLITTPEDAENRLDTRLYPVPSHWNVDAKELMTALMHTVQSHTWEEAGGPATVKPLGDNLLITQTDQAHEEVVEVLKQLEAAARLREQQDGGGQDARYGGGSRRPVESENAGSDSANPATG